MFDEARSVKTSAYVFIVIGIVTVPIAAIVVVIIKIADD